MAVKEIVWGTPSFWIERFPLYLGLDKGFFEELGVLPVVKVFNGGPELVAAMKAGKAGIGEIGLPPFTAAFAAGFKAKVIASSFIQKLDHFLAAKPGINSIQDLAGKRVGLLSRGSCDDYFLKKILAAHGLDYEKDVELVGLGTKYSDPAMFEKNLVDASFLVEPFLSQAIEAGLCKVLFRVGDHYPHFQWGVNIATDDFLQNHLEEARSLTEGYRKSVQYMAANPGECLPLAAKIFNVSEAVVANALKRHLPNGCLDAMIDMPGVVNCLEVQHQLGAVPAGVGPESLVHQL